MSMIKKSYTELITFPTFADRIRYLDLKGKVAEPTFGYERYLNQHFYTSRMWRRIRDQVIIRDNACDLGISEMDIKGKIFIHHINPIAIQDFENENPILIDMDNLICVSEETHNAIHYEDVDSYIASITEIVRRPNDTCPWKK